MLKKVICHFAIVSAALLIFSFIGNRVEKLNPIIKAVNDIKLSDIFFLFSDNLETSSEIYIIDIGDKDPVKSREDIASFIEKINDQYMPKVIGVDVFFDSKYKDEPFNKKLITSLSMDNVIRMFKVEDDFNIFYPNFSDSSSGMLLLGPPEFICD